jgi:hypothetical protein
VQKLLFHSLWTVANRSCTSCCVWVLSALRSVPGYSSIRHWLIAAPLTGSWYVLVECCVNYMWASECCECRQCLNWDIVTLRVKWKKFVQLVYTGWSESLYAPDDLYYKRSALRPVWQEPQPSQATGMALVCCISR